MAFDLTDVLAVPAMLLAVAVPVIVVVVLLRLSRRRFEGRPGRWDRWLGGIARGHVQASHLEAGTPEVDDIAVPVARGRRERR